MKNEQQNQNETPPCTVAPTAGGSSGAASGSAFPPVLDACCGSRAFWFDKADARALFVDKRAGVYPRTHSDTPRAPVVVAPDWQGSFTALPYPADTFDHVIFDPPHIVESSESGNVAKYYGVLRGEWREELRGGFAECFRVLRPGGTLIFKWNELVWRVSVFMPASAFHGFIALHQYLAETSASVIQTGLLTTSCQ